MYSRIAILFGYSPCNGLILFISLQWHRPPAPPPTTTFDPYLCPKTSPQQQQQFSSPGTLRNMLISLTPFISPLLQTIPTLLALWVMNTNPIRGGDKSTTPSSVTARLSKIYSTYFMCEWSRVYDSPTNYHSTSPSHLDLCGW